MKIKITIPFKEELVVSRLNRTRESLSPLTEVFKRFIPKLDFETVNESADNHIRIRNKLEYKITAIDKKSIVVETEYLAIFVVCCSYLKNYNIPYKIEMYKDLKFCGDLRSFVNLNSIYIPHIKEKIDLIDMCDRKIKELFFSSFVFKFNSMFFEDEPITNSQLKNVLISCEGLYSFDGEAMESIELDEKELGSLDFTENGLMIIQEWLDWYKALLNTSYYDIEEKLIECDEIY